MNIWISDYCHISYPRLSSFSIRDEDYFSSAPLVASLSLGCVTQARLSRRIAKDDQRLSIAKKQMMLELAKVHPDGINGMTMTDFYISYLNRAAPKPEVAPPVRVNNSKRRRVESDDEAETPTKEEEEDAAAKLVDLCWTEKYQPTKAKELLGNRTVSKIE